MAQMSSVHSVFRSTSLAFGLTLSMAAGATSDQDVSFADIEVALQQCDVQRASAVYQQLEKLLPPSAGLLRLQASIQRQRGELQAAAETLEQALIQWPADAEGWYLLGQIRAELIDAASVFGKLGAARRTREALARAHELDRDDPRYAEGLATYYVEAPGIAGGDLEKARGLAMLIQESDPARSAQLMAVIAIQDGDEDAGFSALRRAAELGSVAAWLQLARAQVEQGDLRAAIASFQSALALGPNNLLALYGLGRNAAVSGEQLEAGVVAMRGFLEHPGVNCQGGNLKPTHGYWRLGNLLEQLQDMPAAEQAYRHALKLDPDNQDAQRDLKALR